VGTFIIKDDLALSSNDEPHIYGFRVFINKTATIAEQAFGPGNRKASDIEVVDCFLYLIDKEGEIKILIALYPFISHPMLW
jgi:hypothetical protein